jgi:hypothetical protein
MIDLLTFAILAIATMFAVAAAAALSWMFLRVTFVLMQPATARRVPARVGLAPGTASGRAAITDSAAAYPNGLGMEWRE